MLSEQKGKEKRCLNLILHNVPECNDTVAANRKKHDIDKANEAFHSFLESLLQLITQYALAKRMMKTTTTENISKF